jgi:hypothetical protein
MAGKERGELAVGLVRAKQRFGDWRRARKVGARIPGSLWALAVKQAEMHGVSRVATVLGLDYYSLKKRLDAAAAPLPTPTPFVEISPPPIAPSGECVIEFGDAAGASLRVHLKGCPPPDLVALGRSFWDAQ